MSSKASSPLVQEIFLSHSSRDRAFANKVAEVIRRHGLPVWYSPTNIVGAQQWHDEIGRALGRCDWFIVLLSPHAVKSVWVKRELVYALNDARYEDRIIPVLYKPCDRSALSWVLPGFQTIDCTTDFDTGCRDLLRVWGIGYVAATRPQRRRRL